MASALNTNYFCKAGRRQGHFASLPHELDKFHVRDLVAPRPSDVAFAALSRSLDAARRGGRAAEQSTRGRSHAPSVWRIALALARACSRPRQARKRRPGAARRRGSGGSGGAAVGLCRAAVRGTKREQIAGPERPPVFAAVGAGRYARRAAATTRAARRLRAGDGTDSCYRWQCCSQDTLRWAHRWPATSPVCRSWCTLSPRRCRSRKRSGSAWNGRRCAKNRRKNLRRP